MSELLALALFAALVTVLYAGWRRGRFLSAFALVVFVLLGVQTASLLAVETDYRDADGIVDCWPSCSAYQKGIAVVFWYTIPLLVLLTLASVAAALIRRRRRATRLRG